MTNAMTIDRTPDEIAAVIHTAFHDGTQFAAGILHFYEWLTGFRGDAPFTPLDERFASLFPESLEEPAPPCVVMHMYEPIEERIRCAISTISKREGWWVRLST